MGFSESGEGAEGPEGGARGPIGHPGPRVELSALLAPVTTTRRNAGFRPPPIPGRGSFVIALMHLRP